MLGYGDKGNVALRDPELMHLLRERAEKHFTNGGALEDSVEPHKKVTSTVAIEMEDFCMANAAPTSNRGGVLSATPLPTIYSPLGRALSLPSKWPTLPSL
jgi:hypothetical protein